MAKFIMPGCAAASGMKAAANGLAAAAAAAAARCAGGYGNAGGPMTDLWNSAASDMRLAGLANGWCTEPPPCNCFFESAPHPNTIHSTMIFIYFLNSCYSLNSLGNC